MGGRSARRRGRGAERGPVEKQRQRDWAPAEEELEIEGQGQIKTDGDRNTEADLMETKHCHGSCLGAGCHPSPHAREWVLSGSDARSRELPDLPGRNLTFREELGMDADSGKPRCRGSLRWRDRSRGSGWGPLGRQPPRADPNVRAPDVGPRRSQHLGLWGPLSVQILVIHTKLESSLSSAYLCCDLGQVSLVWGDSTTCVVRAFPWDSAEKGSGGPFTDREARPQKWEVTG